VWSYTCASLPVNLAELAGFIRKKGYRDIHILDLNAEVFEIIDPEKKFHKALEKVEKYSPDVIGITCQTIHVPFCVKFTKMLKQKLNIPIVLGGIHPTFRPKELFELCHIDYIIRGEGEETFTELLDFLSGRGKQVDLQNILGLSYKKNGIVQHNPERPLIKNLSSLPFPAYDLLKQIRHDKRIKLRPAHFQFYQRPQLKKNGRVIASRGCPYKCLFCSSNRMWKYQRRKPVKMILKEVDYQIKNLKTDFIGFEDDCLTLNRSWASKLIRGLKKRNISWSCLTRIDQVDYNLLKKMRDSGCVSIYHGIESGNMKMRGILSKKNSPSITNEYIKKIIIIENSLNITSTCSFMVGIPGETEKDFWDTVSLAAELKNLGAAIQFWIMTPYPDTPAVNVFRNYLKKLDRWAVLRQGDVFLDEQMFLFQDTLNLIRDENPDKFVFIPEIGINKFLSNYEKARDMLGLENVSGKSYFVFNYFLYREKSIYFVDFENKTKLASTDVKRKSPTKSLVVINSMDFDLSLNISKIDLIKPKFCYLSVRITQHCKINEFIRNFRLFLKYLVENGIDFVLTKPFPPNFHDKQINQLLNKAIFIPQGCQDCLELFKVERNKVIICGERDIGRMDAFNGRKQIYSLFDELIEKDNDFQERHLCFSDSQKKKRVSAISMDNIYLISPDVIFAERNNKKDTLPFINRILSNQKRGKRFKGIKFVQLNDLVVSRKESQVQIGQVLIFNKNSEEIYYDDSVILSFLCHFNGKKSLSDIMGTLTKKEMKAYLKLAKQLLSDGIIIPADKQIMK